MPNLDGKVKEEQFESDIVHFLCENGWQEGNPSKFDAGLALYPEDFLGYLRDTQEEKYEKVCQWHKEKADQKIVERVAKQLDKNGTLHGLRQGVKDVNGKFQLCQFKPSHGFNPEVMNRFHKNRLRVVRQVPFDPNSSQTLDLVFFVNGIPVATAELKTEFTQSIQEAIRQYRRDRKPQDSKKRKIPLLQFKKRALVHFAVSTEEIHMTTRLQGNNTTFLPFNKGFNHGAGNPVNEVSGYPVAYFWEEILDRENWLDIIGRFIHLEKNDKGEKMIFPRYHQWDCVTELVQTARREGAGNNYLVQHSTGSGKSNSISWLSHRLAGLYDEDDNKIFDSVIVITDRKVLDSQLQDTIYQFDHKPGVVQKINEDSEQLASALQNHVPIIITTLQKFPVVLERIGGWGNIDQEKIGKGKYAVIADEAHSSQTGQAAGKLKYILEEGLDNDEELTAEDILNKITENKGPSKNISFFAFTATPKDRTIELFGRPDNQGNNVPFHLYSMRQAIEEGYILNVLENYVTYKTFVTLAQKNIRKNDEHEDVDVSEAKRKLGKYVVLHPHNISQKIAVIVEHFREKVMHHLNGRAKAMVVTSSREEAARYKIALDQYIKEQDYQEIKALVAFSGKLNLSDISPDSLTEYNMNPGLDGRSLEQAFENEYQIMLVADKFQTGFDQPLLCAMYVIKKLSDVAAVQTLGRLNRKYPGKKTFVIDFVNEAADIEKAFKPYYIGTSLSGQTDPNLVHDLVDKLDDFQVYTESEVQQFAKVYFDPSKDISQGQLLPYIKPAKDRFANLKTEEQKLFKKDLGSFVRAYDFLSMIVPYDDIELEKKCEFARRLKSYLNIKYDDEYINIENVQLSYYNTRKTGETALNPTPDQSEDKLKPGGGFGTGGVKDKKKAPLSQIIEELNALFGGEYSETQTQSYYEGILREVVDDTAIKSQAQNNTFEQFQVGGVRQKILDAVIDNMNSSMGMSKKVLQDDEVQQYFIDLVARSIYRAEQGQ